MIAKNIKKSSEFLIIAPQYMKIHRSKETNFHKSRLLSPQSIIEAHGFEMKSKTAAIDALTKHSQHLINKVKSLSPRAKVDNSIPLNRSRRNHSKAKSKSKKDSSLQRLKSEIIRSFERDREGPVHNIQHNKLHRRQQSQRNFTKKQDQHHPDTQQYQRLLQRTRQLFKKYGERLREMKDINKRLILENSQLKTKLTKIQRL